MDMFDNFVIWSDFKSQKNSGNCLPKKPCRSYGLRLSFCALILHQFSQNWLPFYACKTSAYCTSFTSVMRYWLFI